MRPDLLSNNAQPANGEALSKDQESLLVQGFFHKPTSSVSYVVAAPQAQRCFVIDPVRDFDAVSGKLGRQLIDEIITFIRQRGLTLEAILETHVHADHLSGAAVLRDELGGWIGIGNGVKDVLSHFANLYEKNPEMTEQPETFDRLLYDGESIGAFPLTAKIISTPGHTPACISYLIGDNLFVGDTLFMPDGGTARCDFPGGSAEQLYHSIQRIFSLPAETKIFVCHDYCPNGRDIVWETTVGDERSRNIHIKAGTTKEAFVALRTARDKTLTLPNLMLLALQVNLEAGRLPNPNTQGIRHLKLPLDCF